MLTHTHLLRELLHQQAPRVLVQRQHTHGAGADGRLVARGICAWGGGKVCQSGSFSLGSATC